MNQNEPKRSNATHNYHQRFRTNFSLPCPQTGRFFTFTFLGEIKLLFWNAYLLGEQIWMSQGISNHVRKSCTPTDRRESTTLKNGRNSGNFTTLGKVIDLEVGQTIVNLKSKSLFS